MVKSILKRSLVLLLLWLPGIPAQADDYTDTIRVFRNAGQTKTFFGNSYGYAVFPTIGKGGIGIGGAHGSGRVYAQGNYTGDTKMTQITVGAQLGGQAYSQMIFFQNERAYKDFTSGNFEFGAQATAVAITVGASAQTTTTGTSAGATGTRKQGAAAGLYHGGMAVFTIAKGGLMYEASIGGQKFSYTPKK
ncbi:MAG TPA: hypothetical protein DIC36_06140 [Gammaproteobacteria bacterium]|nr:hypothetical protein [Gammaproteobacteria bacterium]